MFDGIREWAIFKTLLRRKFRGTCSSTDFFTILNECRMTTTQGPQDFFQQLEGIVYQGVRDYPDVVGNPEPLLKRLFLQGLPLWLREYLAIIDELPLDRLVETAQRIWNTRTGVARTEPLADRHPPRPLRAVAPVEEPPEHRRTRWCSYHRTSRHDNTECRYRPRRLACFRSQQEGHLVKDCPFPPPSDGSAPVAGGTRWGQPLQYPRSSDTGAIAAIPSTPTCSPRQDRCVCEDLTVQTHVTTAFHPQANGLVERTKSVVKDALATLVEDQPLDWDRYIPQVRFAINSAIHRAIGDQPLYLLTGQPGHFPVGLSNHVTAGEDAHCKLREALDVARKAAQEASRKARQEYAAYHNRNLRPPWSLEAGSLVLYKIKTTQTGPDRALGPRWQGPAKVVKKLGPVNYVVQDLSPPFSERNCHANQLRPFKLEEELTFPDASPYHDPDYVDPWLPDDAEPGATMLLSAIRPSQHAPQSPQQYVLRVGSRARLTLLARRTLLAHTWNYRSAQDHRFCS
ncbi:Transposon Ty3-G Gag-Pol polyprotein [Penaeus vannamei]|uniref:Transposon Ty3-G Gag-Pol polyprotein n=1 Tax=Penaeus vannamei TaxID=6689 RepID=A0A3R7SL46_PENVA|nr:Transposon Ty3-G Gag-Pol polyprotein [Penaeus vannamei]